jgi:hypothetical protein
MTELSNFLDVSFDNAFTAGVQAADAATAKIGTTFDSVSRKTTTYANRPRRAD